LFFGIATAAIGKKGDALISLLDSISHVMFKVTNYVMSFAPIGIFGAITAVVIQQGLDVLSGYVYLIACFFGGLLFFVFVVLLIICTFLKINFFKLLGLIKEPTLLAFSTASSEAAMPKTIEALEKFGVSNKVVSFVLPLGYSFNLDGTSIYLSMAVLFIAQLYTISLSIGEMISILGLLMLTSKGAAGVTGSGFVVLASTLTALNKIPVEGLAFLLGIDKFMSEARAITNLIGNGVATLIISKLEKEEVTVF
jgi:Na+/H+-dicarboxylate symporter